MKKIEETLKKIRGLDYGLMQEAQERLDNLTKPQGSLGRLEELAKLIVGITREKDPVLQDKVIFTLAGDHGVTEEGISAFPKEVTPQMVYNFLKGGAGINVLANHIGARVVIVDAGVAVDLKPNEILQPFGLQDEPSGKNKKKNSPRSQLIIKKINYGTKNMTKGPAMTSEEAIKAIESGIEIFEDEFKKGIDIIGTGDMGIGNTTPSSAIAAIFTGRPVEGVTGRGTGIDDSSLKNKIEVIKRAIEINRPDAKNPIDVLSKVGGFEIGGLSGIIIGAASRSIPVVIDGFISGAAALIAYQLEPKIKDCLIAAHCSVEKGHKLILEHIGLSPLLDLNMRLGEGTGAALGIGLIEAGIKIMTQMATFKSANVSQKNKQ